VEERIGFDAQQTGSLNAALDEDEGVGIESEDEDGVRRLNNL
jgi:hypothetical protein